MYDSEGMFRVVDNHAVSEGNTPLNRLRLPLTLPLGTIKEKGRGSRR